jgi:hypothetical protein
LMASITDSAILVARTALIVDAVRQGEKIG